MRKSRGIYLTLIKKYKQRDDNLKRHKSFEIGDEVMIHMKKNEFSIATYDKLKMKKIEPCKVLKRFDSGNTYEVELLEDMDLSLIFNSIDILFLEI